MSNLTWMFIAFGVVWIALGLYLISLNARSRRIEKRLEELRDRDRLP
jgi:CcmD family protein